MLQQVQTQSADAEDDRPWRDIYYTTHDGLRLHAREYGSRKLAGVPVVCLPGLTRNVRDFHDLAVELCHDRRVITCDYRGRGQSEYDKDHKNYTPFIEALDVVAMFDALAVSHADVIGTSRGGIIAMLLATIRPGALNSVVLNDIGPKIEAKGLLRITGHITHSPSPKDWKDAVYITKTTNEGAFKDLDDTQWAAFAHQLYRDVDGHPKIDYDPGLRKIFSANPMNSKPSVPEMWPQFKALAGIPVLVIRGENTDILSQQTVERMGEAHPALNAVTIVDRGHAPFLTESRAIRAIRQHLEKAAQSH